MNLTGQPLLILTAATAALTPLLATILWRRRSGPRRWLSMAGWLALVACCQVLAVSTAFLWMNNTYGFFTSWSDLTGRTNNTPAVIDTTRLLAPGGGTGTVQTLTIAGSSGTNGSHQILVWLPPHYKASLAHHARYPVAMILPGQPSTPEAMFRHYKFDQVATAAINRGHVAPFIAVFPPLMTNPPRDTECTDVRGGPQSESWLSHNVYSGVRHSLPVTAQPWSMMGWSTGGFCATKLLLDHPAEYRAAASLGGYYRPLTDHTTGDLFAGSTKLHNQNSPTWLYQHGGLHQHRLLLVAGRQDKESYRPTAKFLTLTHGDPDVSSLTFPTGGHNYHNYRLQLPAILQWLNTVNDPAPSCPRSPTSPHRAAAASSPATNGG